MTKIASLPLIHCSRHIMSREWSPLMNGTPSTPARSASGWAECGSFCGNNGVERRQGQGQTTHTWTSTVVPPGSCLRAQRLEPGAGFSTGGPQIQISPGTGVSDRIQSMAWGWDITQSTFHHHSEARDVQVRAHHHPTHASPGWTGQCALGT